MAACGGCRSLHRDPKRQRTECPERNYKRQKYAENARGRHQSQPNPTFGKTPAHQFSIIVCSSRVGYWAWTRVDTEHEESESDSAETWAESLRHCSLLLVSVCLGLQIGLAYRRDEGTR